MRGLTIGCAAVLAMAMLSGAAQALSGAQQSALRANCRSDFMAHCSSVTPGSKEALVCLQKNVARLSSACRKVVSSTMPPPAHAAAPPPAKHAAAPTTAEKDAIRKHCRSDYMAHCSGVTPGGKEALACLQRNVSRLSPACGTVVRATLPKAPVNAALAPPPTNLAPPPAAAPPPRPRTPVISTAVVGRACLRDIVLHCRRAGFGIARKIACLKAYAADGHRLAPLCEVALNITPMR